MGLNLNYTPNRLVDITTLTEDQWLSWRRKGIGGSDVAVALNSSPYRTARDLYYDKIGVVMSDDGPDKSITFQIGHLLEDVVAQIFAKKTGLSVYEDHWILIGQKQAVFVAIHKCDVGQRNTVLADRIVAYYNRELSRRVA